VLSNDSKEDGGVSSESEGEGTDCEDTVTVIGTGR
jgi:hypothetical protein